VCCKQDSDQDQDSYLLDQDWSRTRKNLSPNTSAAEVGPVSSEISDLCEISDLLLFFSYFASESKGII